MDIFHNILTSVMDDIAPPRSSRIYKNYYAFFHIIYNLRQQQKDASWSRQGYAAQRKIKGKQGQQNLEKGGGTKWDLPERELTWAELRREDQLRISLLLRSVYVTLPSPCSGVYSKTQTASWIELIVPRKENCEDTRPRFLWSHPKPPPPSPIESPFTTSKVSKDLFLTESHRIFLQFVHTIFSLYK